MTIHINAVFERGVFRPARPVILEEGTQVTLAIETETTLVAPRLIVAALSDIAAMPAESPDDGFSGADHDQVLYGSQGAR